MWLSLIRKSLGVVARWMMMSAKNALSRRRRQTAAPERSLFIYSQVVWDEIWQRPQEFARRACSSRPVLFFCPVQVHRLFDTLKNWRRDRVIEYDGGAVRVVTPLILPGEYKSRWIHRWNQSIVRAEITALVGSGRRYDLLTNTPFADFALPGFAWGRVVYDVIDDFTVFDWSPPDSPLRHEELLRRVDKVVTGTGFLERSVRAIRPDAVYVPSGVDFDLFDPAARGELDRPEDLSKIPAPIAGYTGSISDRLDRELIQTCAARYPEVNFVMIGPRHGSFGPPVEAPNIHWLGPRDHDLLPGYLQSFDLALMPFRMSPAAMATNPVKTLEYLAAGRTVLSTAIPDVVRFFGDVVHVAEDREDFVDRLGKLLKDTDSARRERGSQMARERDWADMSARILVFLDDR